MIFVGVAGTHLADACAERRRACIAVHLEAPETAQQREQVKGPQRSAAQSHPYIDDDGPVTGGRRNDSVRGGSDSAQANFLSFDQLTPDMVGRPMQKPKTLRLLVNHQTNGELARAPKSRAQ